MVKRPRLSEYPLNGTLADLTIIIKSTSDDWKTLAEKSRFAVYQKPDTTFQHMDNLLSTNKGVRDKRAHQKETVFQTWGDWKAKN